MALYRFEAKIISRSGGRNTLNAAAYRTGKTATSAAAYRHGTELTDERTGETYDYSRKRGIEGSLILAPADAPAWAQDRQQLWNQVERIEKRKDSQLARDFIISLPHELDAKQRRELLTDFLQRNFVDQGYLCDVAYHAPHGKGDDRNHHAHVMVPMRRIDAGGFAAKKERPAGNPQTAWQAELAHWRKDWADTANRHLEAAGRPERVSHLSLIEQGLDRQAEPKQGPVATQMEREGRESHAGNDRRQVQADNAARAALKADMANVVSLAAEIIRRGAMDEVPEDKAREQVSRIEEAAKQLDEQERQHQARDSFKKRLDDEAEEARKGRAGGQADPAQPDAAQRNSDIADPNARYHIALGKHYDVKDPYASLARAAMEEHGAFVKQQEALRQQGVAEKDPEKRADIELRRRIEGFDYMAITEHRIAGLSDTIVGREDSPRGIIGREQAKAYQEQADKLREQRAERQAIRERGQAQPAPSSTKEQMPSQQAQPKARGNETTDRQTEVTDRKAETSDRKSEVTDAMAERIARMEAAGAAAKARLVERGRTGGRGGRG